MIVPVQVQGPQAPGEIVKALKLVGQNQAKICADAIVLTRGGGSIEDLWGFNDEQVIRAIFKCKIPIVSAVGHEIDVSLSDLVADVRALTPSEAGEILVPDRLKIEESLNVLRSRLSQSVEHRFDQAIASLNSVLSRAGIKRPLEILRNLSIAVDSLEHRLVENSKRQIQLNKQKLMGYFEKMRLSLGNRIPHARGRLKGILQMHSMVRPLEHLKQKKQELDRIHLQLHLAIRNVIDSKTIASEKCESQLEAFNPARVMERGYSLTIDSNGSPITGCKTVAGGDTIHTLFSDGKVSSIVQTIEQDQRENGKEKKTESKTDLSFEESFEELQSIVNQLEQGNMTLGDSLNSYEVGIARLKECYQALNQAELKIRQLVELDEDGNLVTEQFETLANNDRKPGRKTRSKPELDADVSDELF